MSQPSLASFAITAPRSSPQRTSSQFVGDSSPLARSASCSVQSVNEAERKLSRAPFADAEVRSSTTPSISQRSKRG
jgi:hypothetical protein